MTEIWSVSLSVDMLPFGVSIPVTVPQKSEIPEGLMNYPVIIRVIYALSGHFYRYITQSMTVECQLKLRQHSSH